MALPVAEATWINALKGGGVAEQVPGAYVVLGLDLPTGQARLKESTDTSQTEAHLAIRQS
jgi:hypothetical protein